MSIKSAGDVIKEARLRAGLSQEVLSDGICSCVTLCNIEKGIYGVSPLTFKLLLEKAGIYSEVYPIFENLNDYLCFWNVIHARFYIERHKLKESESELLSLQKKCFNENKFYYQEWALLTIWLELKKGNICHLNIYEFLYQAILITKPNINLFDIRKISLSSVEINILLLYIVEGFIIGKKEVSLCIYNQIVAYIENSRFIDKEKRDIQIKLNLIRIISNIYEGNYNDALQLIFQNIEASNKSSNEKYLFEFYYLQATCLYLLGDISGFNRIILLIKTCEEALGIDYRPFASSFFSKFGIKAFTDNTAYCNPITLIPKPDFKDGTFDIYGKNVMTLGSIIRYHRKEQKLSAKTICEGLCGVSLLSKIENNLINPDIVLACAILNRLGLSDDFFTFYGNNEEALFYRLKSTLEQGSSLNISDYEEALADIHKLADKSKNIVIKQTSQYFEAKSKHLSADNAFEHYHSILRMTLKDFDINKLQNYRLSKLEFNTLNLMMKTLVDTDNPSLSQVYYQQISAYIKNNCFDITQQLQLLPTTNIFYFYFLYKYELYSNIVFEMNLLNTSILTYTLKGLGLVYCYYSLALGKMGNLEIAKKIASISISVLTLIGQNKNVQHIKKCFMDEYNIVI